MTLLLHDTNAWDGPRLGEGPAPLAPAAGHKGGWRDRLHLGHADEKGQREKDAEESPEIEPSRSKKHRFSLSRLFRPEDHAHHAHHHHRHQRHDEDRSSPDERSRRLQTQQPPHRVAPLEIPPLLLMNERDGGVTVSGRRVPFTRAAHQKKRHKLLRPLPRLPEDRALGQTVSAASMDAYRRRAYYPGAKHKSKDKK